MELDTRYDPKELEPRWFAEWERRGLFNAEPDDPRPPYTIVIPPPNVTGVLHLGHATNDGFQDALIRRRRMQGRATLWMPGTDHAGIATQNVVEKELRKEAKKRHDLGREKFLERVWAVKDKHEATIIAQLKRMGCSCDWRRTRFTMDEGLSRAVLEVFIRLYEKGLVYRGERLVNWCPRCSTALSDEEAIPQETDGALYRIRYPIKGEPGRFITVATTRPETMLGDTGVAVHPEDERYRDLVGKTAILPLLGREIPIVADAYIDRSFGTGALKVTPAHDPNDFEIGRRHRLPLVNMLTESGKVSEAGGAYAGLDRFDARKKVVEDLEARGLLEGKEKHRHNVPRCQRCDTVLEYFLSKQWFVKMLPLAEPAIRAVKEGKVRFTPERWTAVYLHWMENIHDWCISRQLWWGHRIPVWYCTVCGKENCAREAPPACSKCTATALEQDPDVLDTWFSSWLWPFSTMGWPEKTPLLAKYYPTNTLVTGHEIIFFWVARMIMAGLEFMGEIPFSDVSIHGIVRDEQGRKMSKSLGNGIDPLEVIEETSADALRFTIFFTTPDGQDARMSKPRFEKGRNFCTKLWNASRLILGNLGGFTWPAGVDLDLARPEDRWIVSRLHATAEAVNRAFDAYQYNAACLALYEFTWNELCDWWLEIAKPRLYSADLAEKKGAQAVAAYVLERLLRLLHPITPFITEELWQKLREVTKAEGWPASIMVAPYPEADNKLVDPTIEGRFEVLTSLIRELRNIRAQFNVPPAKLARATVTGGANNLSVLAGSRDLILRLGRLESLDLAGDAEKPKGAAVAVVKDLRCFVPLEGLIDVAAERARLSKQREGAEQKIAGLRKKLDAPGFADRAPPDVVQKTRESLGELESQLVSIDASLKDLQ